MLRLYEPIEHNIFTLQSLIEHLVCNVWCEACDDICDDKLEDRFKVIYNYTIKENVTLRSDVERIYNIFKTLKSEEKELVKKSFVVNNSIEALCNKDIFPVHLDELHSVVATDIKPLFKWLYESLLDKSKVAGDKMEYYQSLIRHNDFQTCPCCGLIDFESFESKYREAYDHYLPKSKYPFASVNFQNLVPLCYKCNSDRKKAKDPIEGDRVVFYPFSKEEHSIVINSDFSLSINLLTLEAELQNLVINFIGDADKIKTWNWLFDIEERYNSQIRGFVKTFLNQIKRQHRQFAILNPDWTYLQTLDYFISDYKYDYYDDKKFLKIAVLEGVKKDDAFIQSSAYT